MPKEFCSQCGPGSKPVGKLYERTPPYTDIFGNKVTPPWEMVGHMCKQHLAINGRTARGNGKQIRIISLK